MFGKMAQQFAAIVCTVLVSTVALTAAVGPATSHTGVGSVAQRSFA